MATVRVLITKLVDEAFPGWVECELIDAQGHVHVFVEKLPVFGADFDDLGSYPRPARLQCQVVERSATHQGRERVTIDTAASWGVQASTGLSRFVVFAEQVVDDEV